MNAQRIRAAPVLTRSAGDALADFTPMLVKNIFYLLRSATRVGARFSPTQSPPTQSPPTQTGVKEGKGRRRRGGGDAESAAARAQQAAIDAQVQRRLRKAASEVELTKQLSLQEAFARKQRSRAELEQIVDTAEQRPYEMLSKVCSTFHKYTQLSVTSLSYQLQSSPKLA